MNRKRPNWVQVGPAMPRETVPIKQFSRLSNKELEQAWELIAPTINKNIDTCPMRKLFAIAYYEGLNHGYFGGKDIEDTKKDMVTISYP